MAKEGATREQAPNGNTPPGNAPSPEPTWIFVGDFLFYLRLLARQFSTLSKARGIRRREMVITPEPSMAWQQLETGACEVVTMDVAESSPTHLDFVNRLKSNHPDVRCILISANLNKEMEAELMQAGADLCFSKPRSLEEASSVFHLVDALVRLEAPAPTGSLPGLPPARFIQFLCARKESGSIALDTEWGEASLVLDRGKIVDASLADLTGDAAAAAILSLNCTQRCLFKNAKSSRFHTIKLQNHELWLKSGRPKGASEPLGKFDRAPATAKSLAETMANLESLEKSFLNVHVETDSASGDGPIARVTQILPDGGPPPPTEEIVISKSGAVLSSVRCTNPSERAEVVALLRSMAEQVRPCLKAGPPCSVKGGDSHGEWTVVFRPETSEFRLSVSPVPLAPPAGRSLLDPMTVMRDLASLLRQGPFSIGGYFDVRSETGWNVSLNGQITREKADDGPMRALASVCRQLLRKELPVRKMVWDFDGCRALVHRLNSTDLLLAAGRPQPPGGSEGIVEKLVDALNARAV